MPETTETTAHLLAREVCFTCGRDLPTLYVEEEGAEYCSATCANAEPTTSGRISLDGFAPVLGQWNPSVAWNGFLCPRIDAWSVEAVMAALTADSIDAPTHHEWDGHGNLVVIETDGDHEFREILPPDKDGLYALGAWGWVWIEDPA